MRQAFVNRFAFAPTWPSWVRPRLRVLLVRRALARAAQAPMPTVVQIGHEAWLAFVAHAVPVLTLAVIGGVLPVALGLAIQRLIALDRARHGVFYTVDPPAPLAWAIQLIAAVVGMAFARGVITHITTHGEGWRAACRVAMSRWASLLIGTVLHIALIVAGAVAIDVVYATVSLDAIRIGQQAVTPDGMAHIAAKRGLDAVIVDAGLPEGWIDALRTNTPFAHRYEKPDVPGHFISIQVMWRPNEPGYGLVVFGGLACLLIAHGLLRMRSATTLWHGLRLSVRHIGCMTMHAIVVRATLCVVMAVAVIAPAEIVRDFGLTQVLRITGLDQDSVRVALESALTLSMALIGAVAWAFEAVYDARLYAALAMRAKKQP